MTRKVKSCIRAGNLSTAKTVRNGIRTKLHFKTMHNKHIKVLKKIRWKD